MINSEMLLDAIKRCGYRLDHVAQHLSITRQRLSDKIKNKAEFKIGEIQLLVKLLHLTDDEIIAIFFAN